MEKYVTGFDVGTDCVSVIVMNSQNAIVFAPEPMFHFGNPVTAISDFCRMIDDELGFHSISSTAFTGSCGEQIAKTLGVPFFHDTITIPSGMEVIAPDSGYIFHIGAKDSYFFERELIQSNDTSMKFVSDHGTGTKCGGGSGILITKQCRRFFENNLTSSFTDIPELNRKHLNDRLKSIFQTAEEVISSSDKYIDVGGRCGVVIQSDMIHLQNSGEQINNILSGLYQRVIKNYKADVLKTRVLDKNINGVVSGGVFNSNHLVSMLEDILGLKLTVPEHFRLAGAAGAVIKAGDSQQTFNPKTLNSITEHEKQSVKTAPPLNRFLDKIIIYDEDQPQKIENELTLFHLDFDSVTDVIIGVDGGSTTTKAVITRASDLKIIARICLYTNGKPLETIQDIFQRIDHSIGKSIVIKAIAYTGSSGAFYHKLFTKIQNGSGLRSMDIVKDEITCHAYGVKHFNDKTDTIFELGGQDAKFTLFNKDGTVKKSRMNLSCMAGTGQTMQNMVEMIGLDINTTFHDYSLKADRTPIVDDTCGVFTEAGIAKLISLGFPKEEIAAAIAYGFMGGYVNKFIGNEVFGSFASAQGGPFNGKAPLAALAMHTGMKIHAFPHRQLFGALGAAIAAYKEIESCEQTNTPYECRFRGLEAASLKFVKSEHNCGTIIEDSCSIKDCRLNIYTAGVEKVISGGACPKGNTGTKVKRAPDYVSTYKKILNNHLDRFTVEPDPGSNNDRVLIPRSLTFLNEKGVFYSAFYKYLGFDVVVSRESDDDISELGLSYAHSETCFPVKLAHGHVAALKQILKPGRDKILLVNAIGTGKNQYKFCPYVSGAGFLAKDAIEIHNNDALLPVIYFDDASHPLDQSFYQDLKRVFDNRFTLKQVKQAIKKAMDAEQQFLDDIYDTGSKLIEKASAKHHKIFIGIGRGYTLFDDKASSNIHELFASNGLHFIPSFFIKPPLYDINHIAENMYWVQGRTIIRYTLESALRPDFFPVRATNFNCGSDSMLLFHEEKIMEKAEKPHLILQTDGHSSNAQFGTRTLANHEVVKHFTPKPIEVDEFIKKHPPVVLKNKLVGIPYMGDNSFVLASTFKSLGYDAAVMPTQTEKAREYASKMNGSNICMPFSYQVGDTLAWLNSLYDDTIDPNKKAVILEPMAKGPCRFGQYHVLLKQIFNDNGFTGVDVLSPDADRDYSNLPFTDKQIMKQAMGLFKGTFCLDILHDALLRTRPYEKEKGTANRVYDEMRAMLCNHIENETRTRDLIRFMDRARSRFEQCIDKTIKRKPIVAVTGEIFVRLHPDANSDSIVLLEKHGLETRLAPLSQWMEYTNKTSIKKFRKENRWKRYITAVLKKGYMESRGKKLYLPFADFLKGREPHDSSHIISYIQKDLIYDKHIEGESPLSIGEAYMFAKGILPDISGIYHVGPFGCMQETAATSQIHSVIRQLRKNANHLSDRIIPFMDAVFGDSELSNLEAEIAVFSEKCYLRQQLILDSDTDFFN